MAATTRLEARQSAEVIRLAPLGDDDVSIMARACLGAASLPAEVDALVRDGADGVPFFVEELLAAAIAAHTLVPADDGWTSTSQMAPLVPRSFAETVRGRLNDAGPQGRRLLGVAALLGRHFDCRLAARAAACTPPAAHDLLERAVAMQLLAADADTFTFRHALTRDAILGELLPTERGDLAARALAELERTAPAGGEEWRHLAADLAQAAGDDDHAAVLLLGAGRSSLRRGALATATAALEQARRTAADAEIRADIEEALAEARSAAGDVSETQAAVAALLKTLDGIDAPPARRGQAHLLLARAAVAATRFGLASDELSRARRLAAAGGDPALAVRVEAVSAHIAIGEGRIGEAEALASRAVTKAKTSGQPEVVCEALEVAARCARTRDLAEAAEISARALEVAEEHGLALWRMRALYQLGVVDLFRSSGVEALQRAREEAQRLGAVATVASLDLEIGAGLEAQWRWAEAEEALTRSVEMSHVLGLGVLEAMGHVFIAITYAERGARRRMEESIGRAMGLAGDDPEVVATIWGDARAVASLVDEDRARARSDLSRAIQLYGPRRAVTPHLADALRALVMSVDGEEVDITKVTGTTVTACQGAGYLAYANAVRLGHHGLTEEASGAAERGDRELATAPWYLHLVRRLSAEAALADGWGEPGVWLDEAASFFDRSGNERLASACRAVLRRTGIRVARRTRAASTLPPPLREAGVTAREAEVLALVGGGLSNREIALRLFLSERTVEHHVGWLRRKLAVKSRAQLVASAAADASVGADTAGGARSRP